MGKKVGMILFLGAALGIFSFIVFLNPRPSVVCDDFMGGPLPQGTVRGFQCQCAGWKFYLKDDAPGDGRDLSVCIGLIKEIHTIR